MYHFNLSQSTGNGTKAEKWVAENKQAEGHILEKCTRSSLFCCLEFLYSLAYGFVKPYAVCFISCWRCCGCMAWSRKHCPGFVSRCYCIINDSSISSPSTAPVSVKPLLLYKFSAWILSLLQVKVIRFEEPKGFVLI